MNLNETLQLLDKLNSVGAKYFKSTDFEVDLLNVIRDTAKEMEPMIPVSKPDPMPPAEPHSAENTKKVEELIDLVKMDHNQLADQIFPAGA